MDVADIAVIGLIWSMSWYCAWYGQYADVALHVLLSADYRVIP